MFFENFLFTAWDFVDSEELAGAVTFELFASGLAFVIELFALGSLDDVAELVLEDIAAKTEAALFD